MKQNCPHGTGKVLRPASWRGEYFWPKRIGIVSPWPSSQVHLLVAGNPSWKTPAPGCQEKGRVSFPFGKIKVGHSLPSVDGSDIPGQPPGACKWWVLFTTFPSTGWFAGFMKINSSIWGLIYIYTSAKWIFPNSNWRHLGGFFEW